MANKPSKVNQTFRLSPIMLEALSELANENSFVQSDGVTNRTQWLEFVLAHFLRQGLRGKVSKARLEACRRPDDIFELFLSVTQQAKDSDDLKKLGEPELKALLLTPDSFLPPEKKQLIQAELKRREGADQK